MTSNLYRQYYGDFFPPASQHILNLLQRNLTKEKPVLEHGFGCGHLLFSLAERGYSVSGIEIRRKAFEETQRKFAEAGFHDVRLFHSDFMDHNKEYDCIYTTGLLQCLDAGERLAMIEAISKRCRKAIIIVPEIKVDRNLNSRELRAVAGCPEYRTGNLGMELYRFFPYVRMGRWNGEILELPDAFLYYVCVHLSGLAS